MINVDVVKTSYRQTKDGFVVTFAIHPQDQHDALALADIGSQWNMQLVPLDENGNAGEKTDHLASAEGKRLQHSPHPARGAESNPSPPPVALAPRSLAQRIGAICTKPIFHRFLADVHMDRWRLLNNGTDTDRAALIVRSWCGVKSRADIEANPDALDRWVSMVDVFELWQKQNPF